MRNLFFLVRILEGVKRLFGPVLFWLAVFIACIAGIMWAQETFADEILDTGVSGASSVAGIPFASITRERAAQSFSTSAGGLIEQVRVDMYKDATYSATGLNVVIYGDSGGEPDEVAVATYSASMDEFASGSCAEVIFDFAYEGPLDPATTYWVAFEPQGTPDDQDFVFCGVEPSGYGAGELQFFEGSAWSTTYDRDIAASVYLVDEEPAGAGGTATSTPQEPDGVLHLFLGIWLFYVSMFFMIWVFKRV